MANFPSSQNSFIANSYVVLLSLTAFIFKDVFHKLSDVSQRYLDFPYVVREALPASPRNGPCPGWALIPSSLQSLLLLAAQL